MAADPEQITFFAKTDARGQNVPFGIKAKDRTRHVYVIGKTGMGKSTLLENMAVQDMQNGNGLAFIDPHGATAETLLTYVPEERVEDVLYFAPFDADNPIAFNVMEDVGPEKRHLVVAGLMSVFKKSWVDAWSARMEYILQNTLLALLEYPDSTLLGVNRMLSEKHYRKAVIDNITDPAVKSFWVDEFLNYNERYMQEAGDSIKNKIGQFTANPLIRNIIGQPHTSFDLRKMMDEKKIIIANLSKGLIGEGNANLLGSMLTTRIYLAAMSRADLSPMEMKQMPNFYFYVDEFQSFANATFADILSEARKYHLNLTIAHQYVEQMEEEVRNAVFGNVGTMISFRVGPFDAEVLETIFAPQFYAVDIVNLGFAQIYLSLMIDGIGSRPFSATTLPPIEVPEVSCRDMVVARSRTLFGSKRETVEERINAWMANDFKPADNRQNGNENGNGGGNNNRNGDTKSHKPPLKKPNGNGTRRDESRDTDRPKRTPDAARKTPPAEATDLNALRDVLRSLSQTDTPPQQPAEREQTKPIRQAAPKEQPTPTRVEPSKKPRETAAQSPVKPAASAALAAAVAQATGAPTAQSVTKDTPPPAAKPPATTEPPPSLKVALKAVLDERKTKEKLVSVAKPATKPKSTSVPAESKTPPLKQSAPPAPANSVTQSNSAPDDPIDPKAIERMLRVTGADNSPLKKR